MLDSRVVRTLFSSMSFKHSPKTPKTPTAVKIQSEDFLYGNQNNFGYYRNVNATFENQENYPFQYVHPNYAAYNFPSAYHNNYEGGNQSSQFNIKHEGYKYANETSQNHYSQFNSTTNSRNGFNTSNYGKFNSDSRKRKRENQHGYDEGTFFLIISIQLWTCSFGNIIVFGINESPRNYSYIKR